MRELDRPEAVPFQPGYAPFFSPDGKWLGFIAYLEKKIKKVPVDGGLPVALCDVSYEGAGAGGASWGSRGDIVFAPSENSSLYRVSDDGGVAEPITTLDNEAGERSHAWPHVLPDGQTVLFTILYEDATRLPDVAIVSITTGQRRVLFAESRNARYLSNGYVVFEKNGGLSIQEFDEEHQTLLGAALPMIEPNTIRVSDNAGPSYGVSREGTLVYVRGPSRAARLVWRDGDSMVPVPLPPGAYEEPAVAPDGKRIAVSFQSPNQAERVVLGLIDERGGLTRMTSSGLVSDSAIWTPDGRHVTFRFQGESGNHQIVNKSPDTGDEEVLLSSERRIHPLSWTPDGRTLAFLEEHPENLWDLWLWDADAPGEPRPFLTSPLRESGARFSPDGRWIAYASDESGRYEVYVQPFGRVGPARQVSLDGGKLPIWSADGDELYFPTVDGRQMMAAQIGVRGDTLEAAPPRVLFEGTFTGAGQSSHYTYDVDADGRFLMIEETTSQIDVVINWYGEVERRLAALR